MNDNRIGLQAHRLIQQRLTCGHAGHDFMHRLFALNLQTIRRIVANGGAVQFVVDQLFQFGVFIIVLVVINSACLISNTA